jgi:hypothetical protein
MEVVGQSVQARLDTPFHVHAGHAEGVHKGVGNDQGPEVSLVKQEQECR